MIEAEAIVNSRPLTSDNLTDPDSLDVLTQNHLHMIQLSSHPPEVFKELMCTQRNVGVGYNNLRINSGSIGEGATCSHFRPDRNGPHLKRTLKKEIL